MPGFGNEILVEGWCTGVGRMICGYLDKEKIAGKKKERRKEVLNIRTLVDKQLVFA